MVAGYNPASFDLSEIRIPPNALVVVIEFRVVVK
jgi:hypothetical protein